MSASLHIDLSRSTCADGCIGPGEPCNQPLFFYHLPRTGGMSFFQSIQCAMLATHRCGGPGGAPAQGAEPNILRIDVPPDSRTIRGGPYAFVATHQPFGCHLRFRQRFLLTTLLRDPVDRALSKFTYDAMRGNGASSEDRFHAAIAEESNCNAMVKQLAGLHSADVITDSALWERAVENLEKQFDTFATAGDIRALTEYYLSLYHLSNLVSERINATQPNYRLVLSDAARSAAAERNGQDCLLFEYVRSHPRSLPRPSGPLHPLTTVVYEKENAARFAGGFTAIATADLFAALGRVLTPDARLDHALGRTT